MTLCSSVSARRLAALPVVECKTRVETPGLCRERCKGTLVHARALDLALAASRWVLHAVLWLPLAEPVSTR